MFAADASPQQQHRVPLIDSVQESLDRICIHKNQPQPDDDVRRRLALVSEENALLLLDQIHNSKTPIRTLNGFISFMIRKVENESPSPSTTTVRATCSSPQSPPARLYLSPQAQGWSLPYCILLLVKLECNFCLNLSLECGGVAVVEQSGGENGLYSSASPVRTCQSPSASSVTPQRLYFSSPGEAPNPSPDSSSSPSKPVLTSPYQILSAPSRQLCERFQGETPTLSPVTMCNGQPPYSSPSSSKAVLSSPRQFLSAPSSTPVQRYDSYQGQIFSDTPSPVTMCNGQPSSSASSKAGGTSSFQILSAPPVTPVQLYQRFQGETVTRSPVLDHPGDHGQGHLEALGELEFRKQFLILSYAGGKKLKDVIVEEDIRSWKNLPMVKFETKVWEVLGVKNVGKNDRRLYSDWDSGKTHLYHCYVSVDGSYKFKGPFLNKTRTLLQKVFRHDNVLMVKFTQGGGSGIPYDNNYGTYSRVIREGILVGLRKYGFFVFKDGGNKEKKKLKDPTSSPVKCYFVRVGSNAAIDRDTCYILSNRTIHEGRCLFAHVQTGPSVANYMARLSLILSMTVSLEVDWSLVKVEFIDEDYCLDESGNHIYVDEKPRIHTDGTGFISEDLALLCPEIVRKVHIDNEHIEGLIDPDDELEDTVLEWKQPGSRTQELPLLMQFRLFFNGFGIKGTFLVNKLLPPKTIQIRPSMVKVKADPKLLDAQTVNSLEIVGTSKFTKKTYLSRNLIALLYHGGVPKEYFMELLMKALEDTRGVFFNTRAAFRVALIYGEIDDNSNVAKMISCGIPLEESYVQHRLSVLMKEEKSSLKKGKICIPDSYYLMGTADPTGSLKKDEVCVILKDGQLSGPVLVYRNPGLHFGDIHVLKATYVEELESVVGNAKYGIFFSCKGPRSVADEIAGGDFDGDLYWISRNPSDHRELLNDDLEDELIKLFLTTRFEPSAATGVAADNWMALMDRFLTLGDRKVLKVVVPQELNVTKFPHFMEKQNQDSYRSVSILGLIYDTVEKYQTEDSSLKEIRKLPLFEVDETRINEGKNQAATGVIRKYKEILYEAEEFEKSEALCQLHEDWSLKPGEKPFRVLPSVLKDIFK
ncbi:hypothetical protein M0R45_003431 [Rubus argutus]|uniref:RNA-dependent RNA polymerase n=1 Tax=Rubus argutus TaxID=59490 RepID=A0AAW1YFG2_RUBAR